MLLKKTKKNSGNPIARICVSIACERIDDALISAKTVSREADVLEIRLDHLSEPEVLPFLEALQIPLLFTNRPSWEGGEYTGVEEKRVQLLAEAVAENCKYIDLELLAPENSHRIIRRALEKSRTKLILSWHNFTATPSEARLLEGIERMQDRGADIGKVITTASSYQDVRRVMQLLEVAEQREFPLIAFCMGNKGVVSRVATCGLGGYMTYCAVSAEEAAAPGQLSLQSMLEIYSLMGV